MRLSELMKHLKALEKEAKRQHTDPEVEIEKRRGAVPTDEITKWGGKEVNVELLPVTSVDGEFNNDKRPSFLRVVIGANKDCDFV